MTPSLAPKPQLLIEPSLGWVEQTIASNQPGRVKFRGTYWNARLYPTHTASELVTIPPGEVVTVIALYGITLLVAPTCLRLEV